MQKLINGVPSTETTTAGETVNPKTVKNVHGVLHSALYQAVLCGYLNTNPADRTILPITEAKQGGHPCAEDQQVLDFFKAIEGHRFQYLYLVDLFTGMRQSELLGLQWSDIDLSRKTLMVKRQLQYLGGAHGGYQYAIPKSNKSRLIVLPDKAVEALERQKVLQTAMMKAAGEAWNNPDDLVFTDELGTHLKHDVIYRNLKRVFASMGVPNLRFHDLRHPYVKLTTKNFACA